MVREKLRSLIGLNYGNAHGTLFTFCLIGEENGKLVSKAFVHFDDGSVTLVRVSDSLSRRQPGILKLARMYQRHYQSIG